MAICEKCGTEFDLDEAEYEFSLESTLEYEKFKPCLCVDCAVSAIEDKEEDVYFETCEECGREFDLIEEEAKFEDDARYECNVDEASLRDWWKEKYLCSDCALKLLADDLEEYHD